MKKRSEMCYFLSGKILKIKIFLSSLNLRLCLNFDVWFIAKNEGNKNQLIELMNLSEFENERLSI